MTMLIVEQAPFGGWRHHLSPALLGALWVLGSCGNGDYDSNGYNGVCRRQAAHILIAEGDTTTL